MNTGRTFSVKKIPSLLSAAASLFTLAIWTIFPAQSLAAHGISIDGKLKYPPGFEQFAYTSAKAVKGGDLILHSLGSFDKMNPYTLKGTAPDGLTDLVFETLASPSLDEPFAEYGLIAKDIELAGDRMSVTFTLNEKARFSDGAPVTPQDVQFSLETLKSQEAHPFYASYYQDISHAEILGPSQIRFHFARPNREIHMIAGQLPVLNKAFYQKHPFAEPDMTPPVGSGPYVVSDFKQGKSITYKRNPDYWGNDLPSRRGMFNFDTVTFKFFKDQIVAVEAFKAGEFDFMHVNIAKQWARDLQGPLFDSGKIIKDNVPHKNDQGMQAFIFNLRKPLFEDIRVRRAIGLAFDFERTNKTLFFDQYTQTQSYFSNSQLAATGLPQGLELEMLEPFRSQVPAEVFTTPITAVKTGSPQELRDNLRIAIKLLSEAGWTIKDGKLADKDGKTFEFEILLSSSSFERVMADFSKNLETLGIKATYRTIDPALYVRRMQNFDFDMTVEVFGQSQSPGNEQRDYWTSIAADRNGSRNTIGIKNPVVDKLVDRIIYATTQEELTAACKALDRVLWHNYYVVPNWYLATYRLAFRDKFARPETLPLYYAPFQLLMTWWKGN
ncbi:MAG: ABC transporter substrate-binding protein [Deltaproteobacteria bacterium]|nr:ABC transporter substrate-binding protein [Deltaproteobacteria bacterium]